MKRQISILLCFVLALTVISPIAIEQSKPKSAQAATAPVEQVCELEDLRTKTSETYLLSDGTRECVVYAENKYYEDAQGKLELIDNSIIETKYSFNKKEYHYQNAANEPAVFFAEDEPAVLAVYGSNSLAYNLIGGNKTSAAPGGSTKISRVGEYSLCGNNYIAYHGVAEQTDLVFAVHNSGVKEYIVLENDAAPSEFVFRFEHAGYSIKEVEYGRLGFFDEKGEQVFSLGSLYAVDAAGKYTDQVVYDLKEYDDTSAIIAITISDSYMQDPERVYPILIDPSVAMTGADQTYDTFVSSKFPNTNYFEDNHLRTGYDDDLYVRRTYMRFIMPSYLYSTAYYITDARIKIRQYIGTTPQAKAYRVTGSWTSGSLTWNNKPGYTATECSALATLDNDNWYNFVVTTIIRKQLNGTYGDYGVMLMDNTESGTQHWSTFYSSEAASPNKPELHITYTQVSNPITINRMYETYAMTSVFRTLLQHKMNCYGYALHVYCETGNANDPYKQQPGEFANDNETFYQLMINLATVLYGSDPDAAFNVLETKMAADFATLSYETGTEWTIQQTTANASVPSGYRKIALTLRLGSNPDYHFYVRHSDNTWSHKPGPSAVTCFSFDTTNVITDSNIAQMATEGGYTNGVKYYLIGKSAVIDYAHSDGQNMSTLRTTTAFKDRAGAELSKAASITGSSRTARFDYAGDVDCFAFIPSVSGIYTISTSLDVTLYDVDIWVYDTSGNFLAGNNGASVTINLIAGERYFFKVSEANETVTSYTLYYTH